MKQWVLVTGCDSGFGLELVQLLSQSNFFFGIFACYHKEEKFSLSRTHPSVHPILLDIRHDKSVNEMVSNVNSVLSSSSGVLSGLVNNAGGLCVAGPIEWGSIESDKEQMDVNFFGQIRVTRALLPLLRKASLVTPATRIVFTSSIMGCVAAPFGASYAASKFALEGWCDALRRELISFGISVHLVEPGMFEGTKFYDKYDTLVGDAVSGYGHKYREYCINRLNQLRKFFACKNSRISVSHALLHALTAPWPKYRYRVGYDSAIVGWLFAWLPTVLADLAITVCDSAILLDRGMIPILPESSRFTKWYQMIIFSFTSYNQSWMIVVLFTLVGFLVYSF